MSFQGFTADDFNTFHIQGLEQRMAAIQQRIQPKFKVIGEHLTSELSMWSGQEMFLHIAKHARRTVNPPQDTWLAIAHNKRGYKKHPHFQVGLFDDHVFIWLAFIYELPNKSAIANTFLHHMQSLHALPNDFVISLDHMRKDDFSVKNTDELIKGLERFRDVKKGEFLVGRKVPATDPILTNGTQFIALVKDTFRELIPLYRLAF